MIRICKDVNNEALALFGLSTPNSQLIICNDIIVGIIDYKVTDEKVKIDYITIDDKHRKQGIARQVMEMIINENKGKYLYGDSLPGVACRFWESLGVEFDEDEDDYLTPFHLEC